MGSPPPVGHVITGTHLGSQHPIKSTKPEVCPTGVALMSIWGRFGIDWGPSGVDLGGGRPVVDLGSACDRSEVDLGSIGVYLGSIPAPPGVHQRGSSGTGLGSRGPPSYGRHLGSILDSPGLDLVPKGFQGSADGRMQARRRPHLLWRLRALPCAHAAPDGATGGEPIFNLLKLIGMCRRNGPRRAATNGRTSKGN